MTDDISIRPAVLSDVPALVRLRRVMFESMGYEDSDQLDAADAAAEEYFRSAIPAKEFYGWVVTIPSGDVVGCGGMVIDRHPPSPGNLSGQTGYIMNLVTLPDYRRQGIARRVMRVILEWVAERGLRRATLHATEVGKPLYREVGFVDSNEMRLVIE